MEKRILQPYQIMTQEPGIGNPERFQEYCQLIREGNADKILPIVVCHKDVYHLERYAKRISSGRFIGLNREQIEQRLELFKIGRLNNLRNYFRCNDPQGAEFLLLDGNHRAVALALHEKPIHAVEVKRKRDLVELNRLTKRGELPEFPRKEKRTIPEIADMLYFSYLRRNGGYTIERKIKELQEMGVLRIENQEVIYDLSVLPF